MQKEKFNICSFSAGPKRGCLNVGAWNLQESGRKAPLSCNTAFSILQCSFSFAAAQLQKSQCCSAVSAAQHSENCSATSVFACGMLQGWGLEGWGSGLAEFYHDSNSKSGKNRGISQCVRSFGSCSIKVCLKQGKCSINMFNPERKPGEQLNMEGFRSGYDIFEHVEQLEHLPCFMHLSLNPGSKGLNTLSISPVWAATSTPSPLRTNNPLRFANGLGVLGGGGLGRRAGGLGMRWAPGGFSEIHSLKQ